MEYDDKFKVGRVVKAKAGRDKGKYFVIIGILDENYVWIANGKNRTVDKPKKKKIKHLETQPVVIESLREKILGGSMIFDAEIRKHLKSLGYEE